MRKVFLIFCIIATTGFFVIPAYSQLDRSCVSDYLDQIVSIAATDDVSALAEIMSLVQYAQLRCLAGDDIPMLNSNGTIHWIEEFNCVVNLVLDKSRERDHFVVQIGFRDDSRDDFFYDLWRDGVRIPEERAGSYGVFSGGALLHRGDSYDLNSLLNSLELEARGTYLVVYEDMETQVAYRVGFEVTRPGDYEVVFGCTDSTK